MEQGQRGCVNEEPRPSPMPWRGSGPLGCGRPRRTWWWWCVGLLDDSGDTPSNLRYMVGLFVIVVSRM